MNWASVPSPFIERSPCASRQVPVLALPEFRGRDMGRACAAHLAVVPCWLLGPRATS